MEVPISSRKYTRKVFFLNILTTSNLPCSMRPKDEKCQKKAYMIVTYKAHYDVMLINVMEIPFSQTLRNNLSFCDVNTEGQSL